MAPIRVPFSADDDTAKSNVSTVSPAKEQPGILTTPQQLADQSLGGHRRISPVALKSLGSLTLSNDGEQHQRPRALPSPDVIDERLVACQEVQTSPAIRVQRPRAVLSSPDCPLQALYNYLRPESIENDEMSCEHQGQPKKTTSIANNAPKAPLSPLDGECRSEGRTIHAAEASLFFVDSIQQNSNVSLVPKAFASASKEPDENSVKKTCETEAMKKTATTCGIILEHKITSKGVDTNDEDLSNVKGSNRVVKKQVCSPPTTLRQDLKKHTVKPNVKGNSGRGIRPWR